MKTIKQAAMEEGEKKGFNKNLFEDSFRMGVEFAQKWISVEEELPEENSYILTIIDGNYGNKDQNDWVVMSIFDRGKFFNTLNEKISHWRPIELK